MLPQRNVNRHLILLWKISYDSTPYKSDARPVDSAGLKLCGAGKWLVEKHGAKTRRSWRKLHIGLDTNIGQIVAAALTGKEIDDGLRSRANRRRVTEVEIVIHALNRMLEPGRQIAVSIPGLGRSWRYCAPISGPYNSVTPYP